MWAVNALFAALAPVLSRRSRGAKPRATNRDGTTASRKSTPSQGANSDTATSAMTRLTEAVTGAINAFCTTFVTIALSW